MAREFTANGTKNCTRCPIGSTGEVVNTSYDDLLGVQWDPGVAFVDRYGLPSTPSGKVYVDATCLALENPLPDFSDLDATERWLNNRV